MKLTEEIKLLFSALPSASQSELLDTLLQEHELRSEILQEASQKVNNVHLQLRKFLSPFI